MKNMHVVIGAGATGTATALQLAEAGESVRVLTRSGGGPVHRLVELVAADATNQATLQALTADAKVIYNCANPPYNQWATDWPPLAASILAAAETSGAVLVTLSNLYAYPKGSSPMAATDALAAPSSKGAIRQQMWEEALHAHNEGRVRATEARASDFIGPGVGASGHMGDRVVPNVLKGKGVSLLGRTDRAHSWTAIDDVARTLIALGADERAWGRAWHVPTTSPRTQEELVGEMARLAGVDPVPVRTIPNAIVRMIGVFVPMLRELREVLYQFEEEFVIDSAETTDTFGLAPTPLEVTLKSTLEHYRT